MLYSRAQTHTHTHTRTHARTYAHTVLYMSFISRTRPIAPVVSHRETPKPCNILQRKQNVFGKICRMCCWLSILIDYDCDTRHLRGSKYTGCDKGDKMLDAKGNKSRKHSID